MPVTRKQRHGRGRTRATKGRKQRGGAYVGEGTYGCGFRPAVRCRGEAARRVGKFAKVVSRETADEEMRFMQIIRPHDPHQKYFLYPEEICEPERPYAPEDRADRCTLPFINTPDARAIILSKGGKEVGEFHPRRGDYPAFFTSLTNLFIGLRHIHAAGVAHNDIKPGNIVTRRMRDGRYQTKFIDIGLMVDGARLAARAADPADNMSDYGVLQSNYMYWSFEVRMSDPAVLAIMGDAIYANSELTDYYARAAAPNQYTPAAAILHYRLDEAAVADIALRLGLLPLGARHSFIFTQSDILGLGMTLAQLYYRLTGHKDVGGADPIIVVRDFFLYGGAPHYTPIEHTSGMYSAADKAWHIAVRDNISIPLYRLVRRMIDPNPFTRVPLVDAQRGFAALLPRIAAQFTEARVTAHLKEGALRPYYNTPVSFAAAAAAAARPASSSPAVADPDDAVLGFGHSPLATEETSSPPPSPSPPVPPADGNNGFVNVPLNA